MTTVFDVLTCNELFSVQECRAERALLILSLDGEYKTTSSAYIII
jgi:hypothetical protein